MVAAVTGLWATVAAAWSCIGLSLLWTGSVIDTLIGLGLLAIGLAKFHMIR